MAWFLYFISILWVTAGSCFILYSNGSREALKKMYFNIPKEVMAVTAIGFGIFFILAASHSRNSWVIILFGILAAAKGIVFLVNPGSLYEKTRDWYLYTATDNTYRFFGIIMLILGTAVFSWA